MAYLIILSWFLMACITFHFLFRRWKPSKSQRLPPGPFPLPVLGNIFWVWYRPQKAMANLAKTYGPIMTLEFGHVTTVVVSSPTLAREVLQKNDLAFSGRMVMDVGRALNNHENSMLWLPVSTVWRNLRKICNSYVFSVSKLDGSEYLRQRKVHELVAFVQQSCQKRAPVNIAKAAFVTSLNLLSNTFFSVDLAMYDTACEFEDLVWKITVQYSKKNIADLFPILKRFDIDLQGIRHETGIYLGKIISQFNAIIDQRLQDRKLSSHERNDVLDALLDICENKSEELERSKIPSLLVDLFVAGTETTMTMLEWAMAELLHNPEKLKKAKQELMEVIGKGNLVEEAEIAKLPYLQAVMKETFRMHSPIPMLAPRKAANDIEIAGYTILKDTQVLVNVWAIARDPSLWHNPDSFEPERFLGSELDVRGRHFELLPFGAGRRICPGLPLAVRMLQLMLGNLIHSFDWELENEITPEAMDMEENFSFTLHKARPLLAIPVLMQ
ncbi:hypothetical protein Droror1_Dr00001547 [Drosera rotundifolia]